jgi:DNA-directed RNA polymerase subunit F
LFEAFLNKIQLSEKEEFSVDEAKKLFNKVCEEINFEPEEPDPYIEKFSEVEPLYLQKIYRELNNENEENQQDSPSLESDGTILSKFKESKPSLVQELEKNSAGTVLDFHHKQKIDSIRKNISIHQKFMFVKELFQNSDNEFNQVIEYLDQCENRDDAIEYLENNYFDTKIWDDEDEVVNDFMMVIDKKFK